MDLAIESLNAKLNDSFTELMTELKSVRDAITKQTPVYTPLPIHAPTKVAIMAEHMIQTKYLGQIKIVEEKYPAKVFKDETSICRFGVPIKETVTLDGIYQHYDKCTYIGCHIKAPQYTNKTLVVFNSITQKESKFCIDVYGNDTSTDIPSLISLDFSKGLKLYRIYPHIVCPKYSDDKEVNDVHTKRYTKEYIAYFVDTMGRVLHFPKDAVVTVELETTPLSYSLLSSLPKTQYSNVKCIISDVKPSFKPNVFVKFVGDYLQIYEETI